jgi:hypothetical protein
MMRAHDPQPRQLRPPSSATCRLTSQRPKVVLPVIPCMRPAGDRSVPPSDAAQQFSRNQRGLSRRDAKLPLCDEALSCLGAYCNSDRCRSNAERAQMVWRSSSMRPAPLILFGIHHTVAK